jgi:cAMP phosphodiesterase
MPISHGSNALGTYTSAAFFVRHDPSSKEFLFFGDVEPDSLATTPLTHRVWLEAAPKIVAGSLSAIFLECSWPSGRPDLLLYGHLTPEHFTHELCVLASEVVRLSQHQNGGAEGPVRKLRRASIPAILARNRKRADAPASPVMENIQGALAGIQIFVTHCKDDLEEKFDQPIQQVIAGQIRGLVEQARLGCEIVAVEQGTLLCKLQLPSKVHR